MCGGNSVIECAFADVQGAPLQKRMRTVRSIVNTAHRCGAARTLRPLVRLSFRFFAALVGLGLLGYLVFRTGPAIVWEHLQAVGWGVALIIVLGGLAQFIKTCAWRQAFTCDITRLSWSRSFAAQLISDGMGQFGVAGKVIGEGTRISLLRGTVPLSSALSAGAIDGGLHTFTAVLVSVSGITATLVLAPLPVAWRAYALLLVAALIVTVILAGVAVTKRWHLVGNLIRAVGRLPGIGNWATSKQPIVDSAEGNLLSFHDEAPGAFWATLILNFLWHLLAVLEVYVILRCMGARIALGGALVIEGLTKVINLVGALNPGNFGTYEAGNMLIAKIFGVAGTAGLTLALCRRVRIFFWAGLGAICMIAINKLDTPPRNRRQPGPDGSPVRHGPGTHSMTR